MVISVHTEYYNMARFSLSFPPSVALLGPYDFLDSVNRNGQQRMGTDGCRLTRTLTDPPKEMWRGAPAQLLPDLVVGSSATSTCSLCTHFSYTVIVFNAQRRKEKGGGSQSSKPKRARLVLLLLLLQVGDGEGGGEGGKGGLDECEEEESETYLRQSEMAANYSTAE